MSEFCKRRPRSDYDKLKRADNADAWFQVYQVAPGIKAIYEAHQWQETISYLVEGESTALLFNTAYGIGDIHGLIKRLTNLFRS